MLVHWIWLSIRKELKGQVMQAVLGRFGDPESAYHAPAEQYHQIPGMTEKGYQCLCDKSLAQATEILRHCEREQIRILTWEDAAYPMRLRGISDPPVVLYCKGTVPDLASAPVIGAVGTRSFSDYGMEMAHRMGYELAQGGAILVSGMAEGIDAGVISGALAARGTVSGFLGCGVDRIYPSGNRRLFEKVLERGCLISEFVPGTQPYKWNFPKRNRLISGISNGVLVVEAPEKSGALITARQAAEQGRDVFAVPGNVNVPSCQGSNRLLQDGANMAFSGWDILDHYRYQYSIPPRDHGSSPKPDLPTQSSKQMGQGRAVTAKKSPPPGRNEKKVIDNPVKPPYIDVENTYPQLSQEERSLVSQLAQGPQLTDDVVHGANIPMAKAMSMLTMLEIKGVVRRLPGNMIELQEK